MTCTIARISEASGIGEYTITRTCRMILDALEELSKRK